MEQREVKYSGVANLNLLAPSSPASARGAGRRVLGIARLATAAMIALLAITSHATTNLRCEIPTYGLISFAASPQLHDYYLRKLGSSSGLELILPRAAVHTETSTIPLDLGTVFGVQVIILGRYGSAETDYQVRWIMPKRTDPATGQVIFESTKSLRGRLGRRYMHSFAFAEAWEMIPGPYQLEIWHDQGKLCTQAFEIVAADGLADAAVDSLEQNPAKHILPTSPFLTTAE